MVDHSHILICDEHVAFACLLSEILEERGFQTDIFDPENIDNLKTYNFSSCQLVIYSIAIFHVDSFQLLAEIHTENPDIPLVITGEADDPATLSRIGNSGATAYLTKPFSLAALQECIENVLDTSLTLPGEIAGESHETRVDPAFPNTVMPLKEMERTAIAQALSYCKGNVPKAAALLDVAPSTLYRKLNGRKDAC